MESTTSVGTCRPRTPVSSSATESESSLFPPAVGPHTTTVLFFSGSPRWLAGVQDVRSGRLYGGLHVAPRRGVRPHVDRVAAPRLPDGLAIIRAAVADVDLLLAPDPALVSPEGVLLHPPENLQEAALHHGVRHAIRQLCGLGTAPGGELEDVGRVEGAVLDEP